LHEHAHPDPTDGLNFPPTFKHHQVPSTSELPKELAQNTF